MTTDSYSERIDWDEIYGAFHNPKRIADRISHELGYNSEPFIFCGFPEVASYLATESSLRFVDYSPIITARSRERYPGIESITEGEITEVLKNDSTKYVVISGRLSAFWQSSKAFTQLANALLTFQRKIVLIDFFDRDVVCEGMSISYKANTDTGSWDFHGIDTIALSNPLIHLAKMSICYAAGSTQCNYETHRAFFRKADIESWCKKTFVEYKTTISAPLLHDDPSFLVRLERMGKDE